MISNPNRATLNTEKVPATELLDNPILLQAAEQLTPSGQIVRTADKLLALKIDDAFIHQLYPLLNIAGVQMPAYFGKGGIGAHISVIYPNECSQVDKQLIGQLHDFKIDALIVAQLVQKTYYILTVTAPSLLALRQRYGLPARLLFKQYRIPLHITVEKAMLKDIFAASYFLRGLQLLKQAELRRFVIMPFLINVCVFLAVAFIGVHYFKDGLQWLDQHLPSWLHWLHAILWLLFGLLSLMLTFYTFTFFANIIAAPFNSLLAEKVELYLTGTTAPKTPWRAIMLAVPASLARQIKLLIYYISRLILLAILSLVPVVHIFAAILWFAFTAWMAALQYLDYPMENNQINFTQMRAWLGARRASALSFGAMTMLFTLLPVINFLAMPAAVAGATLFWLEAEGRALKIAASGIKNISVK